MKKSILLFGALALGVVVFSSCRKVRVCECTYAGTGQTYTESYFASKKNADAYCNANETTGVTCELI